MKSFKDYVLNEINQRHYGDRYVSCVGISLRLRSNNDAVARAIAELQDEGLVPRSLVVQDAPPWFRKRRRSRPKQMSLLETEESDEHHKNHQPA